MLHNWTSSKFVQIKILFDQRIRVSVSALKSEANPHTGGSSMDWKANADDSCIEAEKTPSYSGRKRDSSLIPYHTTI